MGALSSKNKLSILLVLFPPLILLVYAAISYLINFYTQQETINVIRKNYLQDRRNIDKKLIQSDALVINNYITTTDGNKKELLGFLKSFYVENYANVLIVDKKNSLIYDINKDTDSREVLKIAKGLKEGFYEADRYSLYIKSRNTLKYKIISYLSKARRETHYKNEMHGVIQLYKKSTRNHLWWLGIAFVFLFLFSIFLSKLVYSRLKEYEESVAVDNKRVIFQSRQALLGELLPMIAHQWRQPLNKIASILMRMRFEISGSSPNAQTLDMQCQSIEDSVELMSQTIDDFRTFYRPKENPQEVDLALLIRKALYFLDELLHRKKISIHSDLAPVKIKLHANEFLQVIINLIKNASDAVSVQGNIYISLHKLPDGAAEIRIEDDGVGIPKEKLETIFDAHVSSKQASMGLGLYMSRIIIEQHFGGKIQAYNSSRGAGFYIFIPQS